MSGRKSQLRSIAAGSGYPSHNTVPLAADQKPTSLHPARALASTNPHTSRLRSLETREMSTNTRQALLWRQSLTPANPASLQMPTAEADVIEKRARDRFALDLIERLKSVRHSAVLATPRCLFRQQYPPFDGSTGHACFHRGEEEE